MGSIPLEGFLVSEPRRGNALPLEMPRRSEANRFALPAETLDIGSS